MEPLVPPAGIEGDASGLDPPEIGRRRRVRWGLADTNMPSGDAGRLEGRGEAPLHRIVGDIGAAEPAHGRGARDGGGERDEEVGGGGEGEGGAETRHDGKVGGERRGDKEERAVRRRKSEFPRHMRSWIANQNVSNNGNNDRVGNKEDGVPEDGGRQRQQLQQVARDAKNKEGPY